MGRGGSEARAAWRQQAARVALAAWGMASLAQAQEPARRVLAPASAEAIAAARLPPVAQPQARPQAAVASAAARPAAVAASKAAGAIKPVALQAAGAAAAAKSARAPEPPEPLGSAPEGGLSVAQMLEALEGERRALLAMSAPGAVSEARVPAKALKKGAKGEEVKTLCEALLLRGFIEGCDAGASMELGPQMSKAVLAAQKSYGLVADGLADAQLYNALRMSAGERAELIGGLIAQWGEIEEQARQMGASRYIVVNIPSFEAKAVGGGEVRMSTPVVVGKPGRQTPVGVMNLTALKFNPNWTPPPTILKKDVYPRMKSGGSWIEKHGLVLLDREGNEVEWRGLSVADLRENGYRFVQPPGPSNALGQMKFETDSKEDIYLHDTNERSLFNQAMRARSSGCVRVKEWRDLASWAAAEKAASIEKKLATEKTFFQKTERIPVFVTYQLADFQNGRSTVYPDIYKRVKKAAAPAAVAAR